MDAVTFTMLQLVLLLIANALDGTIGQRGKVEWPLLRRGLPTEIGRVQQRIFALEHGSVTGQNRDRPK